MNFRTTRYVGVFVRLESLESRRLLARGLDPSFGIDGISTPQTDSGSVTTDAMILQSGTQFLVLGHTSASNPLYFFRYDPATGQADTAHVTDARLASLKIQDPSNAPAGHQLFLARQSSGKIILAGRTDSSYVVARFNPDGTPDSSFGSNGVTILARPKAATTEAVLLNACVASDDKIVVIARQAASDVHGGTGNLVAVRLTASGAVDTSYGTNGIASTPDSSTEFDLWPSRAFLLADGKIVTAGDRQYPTPEMEFVARYNADLSTDTTFGDHGAATVNVSSGSEFQAFALAPDGKLYTGNVPALSRFNADGSADTGFDSDGLIQLDVAVPPQSGMGQIIPEADGKVTVLFDSTHDGDYPNAARLVRFNANGSLDTSFGTSGQKWLSPLGGTVYNMSAIELDDGRIAITSGESVALSGERLGFDLGANGTLFVTGTTSADTISVSVSGSTLHAVLNGVEKTWPLTDVKRLDIVGDAGNDVISVSVAVPGLIDAAAGNDSITLSGAPATSVTAGDGNDTIIGSDAADSIDGGAGDDSIDAGAGNDSVTDNSGKDTVILGDGNDSFECHDTASAAKFIDGGAGDDALQSYSIGAATMIGGVGNDLIVCGGAGAKQIDAGDDNDSVNASFTSGNILCGSGDDLVTVQANSVQVFGGDGNDVLRANTDAAGASATIYGEDGFDTITASEGNDLIVGGANKDSIRAGGGNDTIRGFGGHDRILGQGGDDLICGAAGNDKIDAGSGLDTIYGCDGDDSILGGANKDIIYAGSGNDTVRGHGGNDQIFGQGGEDYLWGNAGNDRLDGGDSNDVLCGDAGSNRLSGNAGDDIFWADNSTPDSLDGGDGVNRGTFDDLLDTVTAIVPA